MFVDLRHVMSQVIAQLCNQVGFERITESALDLLIDVAEQYIRNLGLNITKIAHLSDDTAQLEDGLCALQLLGQSPKALLKFTQELGPWLTAPPPVLCGPLSGKVQLNIPPDGHEELDSRPRYIPPHLPLNFCLSETNGPHPSDSVSPLLQSERAQTQNESNVIKSSANTSQSLSDSSVTHSSFNTGRNLPVWASQITYRLTRISVDPLTKNLVEHAYERIPESFYDLPDDTITRPSKSSALPVVRDGYVGISSPTNPSVDQTSRICSQGATDAQWAAALQATPVPQPAKRIVYTPSRFDPSSLPAYMSSVRRSVTTGLSSTVSATAKRLTTSRPVNSYRVRSTPVTRAPTTKIASLSSKSKRRGSSSVGRAHRWAHKRVVRKKRRNDRSSILFPSSAHSAKVDLLSPSADQTPPLRTNEPTFDVDSSCLKNPKSSAPPSPVSDTTPPIEPTSIDSCASKNETVDQIPEPAGNNALTLLQECVEKRASDLSPGQSLPEPITSALIDGDLGVPPENSQGTPRLMTQSFSTPTNSANNSPPAHASLHTRALRHRGRKRGRGRNEPTPRMSIINSLFQNPLRQKAPQPRLAPASKVCDSHPCPSSTTSTISAASSKQLTPSSAVPTAVSRPDRTAHANRGRNSHYSKRRDRVSQSSPKHRSSPPALNVSASKATFDGNDNDKSSPASDSTEPMIEAVRAKLLEIPQALPFDFKSDDNIKSVNCELKLVTFSGQSFGTLRTTGLKPTDSLPSSPSSIESSFSSSASSISNLVLNDTARTKRPENFSIKSCTGERQQVTTMRFPCLPDVPSLIPTRSHLSPSCSSFASSTLSSVDTLKPSIGASPLRPLDMPHSPSSTCPPPLLPLSTQLFDTSQSRNLILHPLRSEHTGVLPPPPLVPVSEFSTASTKPESSFSVIPKSCDATENTDLDPHRSSGVGLLGSIKVREKLASSLSPSSSSSTSSSLSSSGSTPAGSYCVDRVPVKITQPTPARESSRHQQSPSPFSADQHGLAKTPKIVIRLGGVGTPGGVTRLQSSLDKSYDQLDHSETVCTDVGSNLKSAHPPPLKLTIYRDRLTTYRGSSSSRQADSNSSSSSSGSETLLSSGDEDDHNTLSSTRPVHLPPPPCLERLPDGASLTTNENVSDAPPLISCRSDEPKVGKLLLTSRSSPLRDNDRNADVTHNQLPPLLPLFSTISQPTISAASRHSSPSTDLTNVLERTITKQNSSVNLSKKRKRPRSKEKDRANKRRLVMSETLNPSIRIQPPVHMSVEKVQQTLQPRVRVDSVFTDDENDSKNNSLGAPSLLEKPSLIPLNLDSCARGSAVSAQRITPKACKPDTSLSSSPKVSLKPVGDSKRAKGRPRTKHTADLATTNYSPVVKASPKPDPLRPSQSPIVRSKQHSRVKHIPASASTSSSSMPVRGLSGSQRQTSQVVVASAGSSYYFNSSGEQIWLCPVCLLEDDGNLMIGCDSCDDWYHGTCLGLSAEPEVPQWFCPKCAGTLLTTLPTNTTHISHPLTSSSFVQPSVLTPKTTTIGPGRKQKDTVSSIRRTSTGARRVKR